MLNFKHICYLIFKSKIGATYSTKHIDQNDNTYVHILLLTLAEKYVNLAKRSDLICDPILGVW